MTSMAVLAGLLAAAAAAGNDTTCGSPTLPTTVVMRSEGCGWATTGMLTAGMNGPVLAHFKDDCEAWNPSDLIFDDGRGTTYLTTDQKTFSWTNTFRLRDCNAAVFATVKVKIVFSFSLGGGNMNTDVTDADGNLLFTSRSASFWDVRMIFADPTGQQSTQSKTSNRCASAVPYLFAPPRPSPLATLLRSRAHSARVRPVGEASSPERISLLASRHISAIARGQIAAPPTHRRGSAVRGRPVRRNSRIGTRVLAPFSLQIIDFTLKYPVPGRWAA